MQVSAGIDSSAEAPFPATRLDAIGGCERSRRHRRLYQQIRQGLGRQPIISRCGPLAPERGLFDADLNPEALFIELTCRPLGFGQATQPGIVDQL